MRTRAPALRVALALLVGGPALGSRTTPAQSVNNYDEYLITRENFAVCVDQNQPLAKRVASCAVVLQKEDLAKRQAARIHLSLAQALQQNGNDEDALRNLNAAVRADPKYEQAWLARANFHVAKAHFADALADFNTALAINPKDPVAYVNRAIALNLMGRRAEGIADLTSAIKFDPQDLVAYSNRATLYLAENRLDLVIADLSVVIRAAPTAVASSSRIAQMDSAIAPCGQLARDSGEGQRRICAQGADRKSE